MRICLVHGPLGPSLRDLGHEVLEFSPAPGLFAIDRALAQTGFRPDLLVQTEVLGPRVLLVGLAAVDCLKLFWSVDTHLNAFWHVHYGALFDAVATTQASWVPRLRRLGLRQVFALPWCGLSAKAPAPFADRSQAVAFCGRLGKKRPLRQRFARHLRERFQATLVQDVPRRDLLALYGDTCLAPNESIAGEINFRLFEAASMGCLVLTQTNDDLPALFTPGREVDTYADAAELDEKLRFWLARPAAMERLGRQARARVLAEHLPCHRAAALLRFAATASRLAGTGRRAELPWLLTLLDLAEAQGLDLCPDSLEAGLRRHLDQPDAAVGLLRLHYYTGNRPALAALLSHVLGDTRLAADTGLNCSASLAGLLLDDWHLAKVFWLREHRGQAAPRLPETPAALLTAWANVLSRLGRDVRLGLEYDTARHLPQAGLEAFILAYSREPARRSLLRSMETLLAHYPGTEETRLACLSELSLHEPQNWRLGLRLGLVDVLAFRLDEGLAELRLAQAAAHARQEAHRFLTALAHEDPRGVIRRALAANRPGSPD